MKSIFENFKKADFAILGGVILVIIILTASAFGINKYFFKTPVLEEKDVYFSIFFRGVTITDTQSPFKIGEKAFITIRNVPYTKLYITDVKFDPRRTLLAVDNKGNYRPVVDISQPCVFDFVVTVKDKAKLTEDGAVIGGNKVKIGIPVILEGANYKLTGVISNVQTEIPDNQPAQNENQNGNK